MTTKIGLSLLLLLCSIVASHAEELKVDVRTDWYPYETTWSVVDECNGAIEVMSGGPYKGRKNKNKAFTESVSLPPSMYTFKIFDSYGDGNCKCWYSMLHVLAPFIVALTQLANVP